METATEEDIKLEDFEPPTQICRGCLVTERNMKDINNYFSFFKEFTGIDISENDGLPQWFCHECAALLQKCIQFKNKLLQANNTLYQYLTRCAPFGIEGHNVELSKYATPYLTKTEVLTFEVSGKGKNGNYQVLQHEKQIILPTLLLDIVDNDKNSNSMKEESLYSDYDDNITLEEIRFNSNKLLDNDIDSLLKDTDDVDIHEINKKEKKKKTKKKEHKIKKDKIVKEENETLNISKSSIRKPIELDPTKIRIVTLNPEEQIKQKQEESLAGLKFPFQCNLCHKGFNFESKLENHMTKHSPSRGTFECKLCQMYLPTSYSYNVHNLIHTRRYECVECGRRMIDRTSIIDHYRTQHEGLLTLFTCQVCGKVSNNRKTHRGHMRNHHSGDRPKCDQCGKSFVNKDSLTEHIQIHEGVKNYECSVCGKRFRTRTQIKHHQLKHSDVKEFYCVECDVRFKSAHSLRQHLVKSLKHKDKGTLIYPCVSCDKRFETHSALTSHARIQHEGVRSHVCQVCGSALATRSSLAKHMMTVHGNRRPPPRHVCHTCGKAFRGKSVLTNHVRTHTGEKPFECTTCGRKFSQRTAMRTHYKLVHLKQRRQAKIKPELLTEPLQQAPKLEVFKPEPPLEPWRQPCDVYFTVTAGP